MTREASWGRFSSGWLHALLKPALAMALFALCSVANAVTVVLVSHNQTSSSGTVSTLITDGTHTSGISGPSTAVWDWDGTTLTSTGLYAATSSISSSKTLPTVLSDQITNLSIDTSTGMATAAGYACIEGTFLSGVGASGCGGYNLGTNSMDDSTAVWGPGTAASRTINPDDLATATQRMISAYDFGPDAFMPGDPGYVPGTNVDMGQLMIGNGIPLGSTGDTYGGGELMTFDIQSAAVDDMPPSVRANETLNIDVLANDDLLDDIQTLTTTNPANGNVTVNGVPGPQAGISLDYKSAIGFSGDASFDYTVTDASGNPGQTATVTVTVTNLLPVAVDDGASADGDPVAPVATNINVLSNDTLGDTGPGTPGVTINTGPSNGTIGTITGCDMIATCSVPYTPDANFFGMDSFTYDLQDGNGDVSTATVTVTVSALPSAADDNVKTDAATPIALNPLTNDAGLSMTPLTVTFDDSMSIGGSVSPTVMCTDQATCELTYTPDTGPDFVGNDSFTYTVTDAAMNSDMGTVNVFVNDMPVAVDDPANLFPVAVTAMPIDLDVQNNDTGLNDAPITVNIETNPMNGMAAVIAGQVRYTSDPGFNGTDTFDYSLTDSAGNPNPETSNTATVSVDVNDMPVANNDGTPTPIAIPEGTTASLDILANDTGLSDTPLTVAVTTPPANAGSTATPTGSPGDASTIRIDYTAGAVLGADSFDYQVTDNSGDMSSATVSVTVTDVDFPMAVDDAGQTVVDTPVSIDVLANDTGLADTPLSVTITTPPSNGTLGALVDCDDQAAPPCQVPYTPDPGFMGTDTFQYMVTDNTPDNSNIATVTITVTDQPVAVDDTDTIDAGQTSVVDVLANDSGLSDTPLTVAVTGQPSNGSIGAITDCDDQAAPPCQVPYTPGPGFTGTDSYEYTVTDAQGDSDSATVTVTVNALPTNDIPKAVFDEDTAFGSQTVGVDVLANDLGLSDVPLQIEIETQPSNGRIGQITGCDGLQNSVCEVSYTANAGFAGDDTFQYKLTDSTPDESNTATVLIHVEQAPVAVDDTASTALSKSVTINVLANDTGLDNQPLTLTISADPHPDKGTASVSGSSIVYTSIGDEATTDTFKYTVTDANGSTSEATVTVTINEKDDELSLIRTSSMDSPQFKKSKSTSMGLPGLGLLMLVPWLRRRLRRRQG